MLRHVEPADDASHPIASGRVVEWAASRSNPTVSNTASRARKRPNRYALIFSGKVKTT